MALYADLTEQDAAEQIYNFCHERGIEVDILINNAWMLLFSQMTKTSEQQLQRIVALHCTTPTMLCRLFGSNMCERGSGHILLMSSITAWTPYPTISHYAATKAYLKNFGEAIWWEMRRQGVQVTTVFPSAVDTPFYNLSEKLRRRLLWWGVMMTPDEVARRGLRAMFKGRRKCLPGVLTTLTAGVCAALPGCILRPIVKIPAVKRILEKV
jgi:short-subunit dehydrogenase